MNDEQATKGEQLESVAVDKWSASLHEGSTKLPKTIRDYNKQKEKHRNGGSESAGVWGTRNGSSWSDDSPVSVQRSRLGQTRCPGRQRRRAARRRVQTQLRNNVYVHLFQPNTHNYNK